MNAPILANNNGHPVQLINGDYVEIIIDCHYDFEGEKGFVVKVDNDDTTAHIKVILENGRETWAHEVRLISHTNLTAINNNRKILSRNSKVTIPYNCENETFTSYDVLTLEDVDDTAQPFRVLTADKCNEDWVYFVLPFGKPIVHTKVGNTSNNVQEYQPSANLLMLINSSDEDEENTFTIVPQQNPLF